MKLLEFITYCTVKGLVLSKKEVDADWDHEADSHWKIVIATKKYMTTMAYSVVGDTGVVMSCSLRTKTMLGIKFTSPAYLRTIVDAILSDCQ